MQLKLKYQACDDKVCLAPASLAIPAGIHVDRPDAGTERQAMSKTTVTIDRPGRPRAADEPEEFEHAEGAGGAPLRARAEESSPWLMYPGRDIFCSSTRSGSNCQPIETSAFGVIVAIAGGGECKLLIDGLESERHPDLAIYKTTLRKGISDDEIWSQWIPEIVIEVVSASSRYRDYEEKPEEYLRFGVREYWIVDPETGVLKVFRRSRGRWAERTIKPPQVYNAPLLPGFEFSIETAFKAADAKQKRK